MIESTSSLFAYIDPGTGSIVIQVLIATFLSAGVIFRRALVTPIALFCSNNRRHGAVSDRSGEHQEEAE